MNPDTTVKTAALVAAGTSNILNKTNSLFSHGYRDQDKSLVSCEVHHSSCKFVDQGTCFADQKKLTLCG